MDTKHREAFFNMLLAIQLIMLTSAEGTDKHNLAVRIFLELQELATECGAVPHEFMGIVNNAHNEIEGLPHFNIDRYIEDIKLYEILRDIDI